MKDRTRLYTGLAIGIFCAAFIALVLVATFCDLAISKIMTKNALPAGAYFSTSNFGRFFETVGSAPIYLMASVAGVIFFWWGVRNDKKYLQIIFSIVGAVAVFAGAFLFASDIFSYLGDHIGNKEFMSNGYVKALSALIALIIYVLLTLCWRQIKPETNKKLFKWAIVILCTLAMYLIIHFIKSPIGRMRFRTMNALGDTEFSGYTPWYVVNGKRNVLPFAQGVEIDDSCKSFPSGHTFSAGVIYTLICLPDLVECLNKKWIKALFYVGTTGFTAIVAISRIMVGAHYMSDVLFGGTIAFVSMIIFREIFIFKGSHLKALFGKNKETAVVSE